MTRSVPRPSSARSSLAVAAVTAAVAVAAFAALAARPATAHAFCGFYVGGAGAKLFNNATQVVLMRHGTRTVMSMANNYQGPAADFAMVVPVPVVLQEENVKTLPSAIFERVDLLSSPRLVEYWEQDPCPQPRRYRTAKGMARPSSASGVGSAEMDDAIAPRVRVEAQFAVGEYDIVILSADDSLALYDWLVQNKYNIPTGAEKVLRPYIAGNMKFFVAKVNIGKVQYDAAGKTMLSPLRFHFDSDTFSLPIRLGLLNAQGAQDLIVHILAQNQRYEVANYKNVTVPTNIYIRAKTKPRFGEFYASLFDSTVRANPRAVITEYAWDAQTCDPCPGPNASLQPGEILSLGGDVIFDTSAQVATEIATGDASGQATGPARRKRQVRPRPRPRPPAQSWVGWTLTRLHARYSKDTVGDDLVFRAATPIVGGREIRPKGRGLEHGATRASTNNFQGRYIIRYKWKGPVACKNPQWGIWGGPPGGILANGVTSPGDVAFVKNRGLPLRDFVLQKVPEIRVAPRWARDAE